MLTQAAFALDRLSIRNVCLFYFFAAPMLQDNANVSVLRVVVAAGYLISGTILLLALSERLARLEDGVRFTGMSLVVIGLIGLCFFSLAVNSPGNLLKPSAYYYKYFKLVFPVGCFFVMINVWTLRDASRLYALLLASAACAVLFVPIEALFLSRMGAGYIPRVASYFIDANKYALFLNVVYGFTLPLLIHRRLKGGRDSGVVFLVLLAIVSQLFLSQSRGGILTTGVITAVCFLPRPARALLRSAWPAFAGVAALLLAGFALRYVGGGSGTDAELSNLGRLLTYSVGYNIVTDRPFLGIGFANILTAYDVYGLRESLFMGQPLAIHNATLEIFAEEGFFGMVLYLLLVFVPVGMLVRRIRRASAEGRYSVIDLAALGIPLAFFGFGLFSPNYLPEDFFWVYMSFTVMVIRSRIPGDFELRLPRLRL